MSEDLEGHSAENGSAQNEGEARQVLDSLTVLTKVDHQSMGDTRLNTAGSLAEPGASGLEMLGVVQQGSTVEQTVTAGQLTEEAVSVSADRVAQSATRLDSLILAQSRSGGEQITSGVNVVAAAAILATPAAAAEARAAGSAPLPTSVPSGQGAAAAAEARHAAAIHAQAGPGVPTAAQSIPGAAAAEGAAPAVAVATTGGSTSGGATSGVTAASTAPTSTSPSTSTSTTSTSTSTTMISDTSTATGTTTTAGTAGSGSSTTTSTSTSTTSAVTTPIHQTVDTGPTSTAIATQSVAEGSPLAFDAGAHFAASTYGGSLTFSASSLPTGLSIDPRTGVISGAATDAMYGNNAITVTATDSHGMIARQSFVLSVTDPGIGLTAVPALSAQENTSATGLATASVPAVGDSVTFSIAGNAQHGQATIDASGNFIYTPGTGFAGTDSFDILATDSHGATATRTVTVTIKDPGVTLAASAAVTGTEDKAVTGSVSATTATGNTLTYAIDSANGPSNGSVSIDSHGNFTYTPKTGYAGTDSFQVVVTDNYGASKTETMTVTVKDPGVTLAATAAVTGTEDKAVTGTIAATTADGNTLTYAVAGSSGPVHGSVTIDSHGNFTFTPKTGYAGTDNFQVVVTDNYGASATENVSVTVKDPGVTLAANASVTGTENQAVTGVIAATTAEGNTLTYAVAGAGEPAHGSVTIDSHGNFTFTPKAGYVGNDSFQVVVTDNYGASKTETVTVTLNNPGISAHTIDTQSVAEGKAVSIDAGSYFTALVKENTLTFSASLPSGLSIDSHTGVISGTATDSMFGNNPITVTATDNYGVTARESFVLSVTDPGTSLSATGSLSTPENTAVTGQASASAAASGVSITYSIGNNGEPQHGQVTIDASGNYVYTPGTGFAGTDSFDVVATDSHGASATHTVTVTVADPGVTLTSAASVVGAENQAVTGTVVASAATGNTLTYAIASTGEGAPAHGSVTIDSSGNYTYTPSSDYSGSDSFQVVVTDNYGASSTQTVTVNLSSATQGPQFSGPTAVSTTVNTPASFTLQTSDSHSGETLTGVTVSGAPAGSYLTVGGTTVWSTDGVYHLTALQAADGTFVLTPPADYTGTITLQVNATADNGSATPVTSSESVTLTVNPVAGGATIAVPGTVTTNENSTASFSLAVSDTNSGETVQSVTISGAPTGSTLMVGSSAITADAQGHFILTAQQAYSSTLSLTPPTDYSGTVTLQVTATADNGTATPVTSNETVTLTVAPISQGATISAPATVTATENSAASFSLTVSDSHTGEAVQSVTISGASSGAILTVNGTAISQNTDGSFSLTPSQAASGNIVLTPPTDYSGTMTLTVSSVAANGAATSVTSTDTISLQVTPVVQGATIAAPSSVGGIQGSSSSFSLAVSDSHLNESVTGVTITGAPSGTTLTVNGTAVTQAGDGSFTLTPSDAASGNIVVTPPSSTSGTVSLTINATAGETGATAVTTSQTVQLNISAQASNGATISTPTTLSSSENHSASFVLNVTDNHSGDSIEHVSITGAPAGAILTVAGVAVAQNADGSFTLSAAQAANHSVVITPPTDYSGSMSLTVNATSVDGQGHETTNSQALTYTVTAQTQGAAINAPTTLSSQQHGSSSFTLDVSDSHANESVTGVTIAGAPAGTVLTVNGTAIAQNTDHSFTLTPDQASSSNIVVTPPDSYTGAMTLQVNATADETGAAPLTTGQTITYTVTPVTQGATITAPASVTTNENTAASFSLAVSDTNSGETVQSVAIAGAPAGSTLIVGSTAITADAQGHFILTAQQASSSTLSLTPPADYTGTITLQVNATAQNGTATPVTSSETVTLTVTPVTQGATITAPASVTTDENSAASISLAVSDNHTGETVQSVTIAGAASGSTLTVGSTTITADAQGHFTLTPAQAANANLSLTPPTDYSGTMTLTVSSVAQNGAAASVINTDTISLHVTPVVQGANIDAPLAVGGIQGSSTGFSLAVSDSHLNESVTGVTITGAPSGTTLTVNGDTITQAGDHSFTLTPLEAASADIVITPPSSTTGTVTLTINATAGETGATAATTSQTVQLNISAQAATGATISAPATVTGSENHSASFVLNVVDNNSGDNIEYVSIVGAPAGTTLTVAGGAVPQNADGSFTLSPDQAADASVVITPPADYSGSMHLTLSATSIDSNDSETTNSQALTYTVTAQTQGASIAAPGTLSGQENSSSTFVLNVSDSHLNESVTGVTITGAPAGTVLTVNGEVITQNTDLSFTLTPTQASSTDIAVAAPTDFSGTMTLQVNATAAETGAASLTDSQTIAFTVSPVTQGATITAPVTVNATEDQAASFSLNVSDSHTGESVTGVTIYGVPTGSTLFVNGTQMQANGDGSYSLTPSQAASGSLSLTPPTDYSGSITLTVDATAQNGTATAVTSSQTITLDVSAQTQGATISAPTSVTATENHAATIALTVSDSHLNESVTGVTITGAPQGASLIVGGVTLTENGDGSFSLTPAQAASGSIQLVTPTDYSGTVTLHVNATADATGAAAATVSQTITVNVEGMSQGATISAPQSLSGIANTPTVFTLNVTDGHLGETVTAVTITGAPTGTTLTYDGQTIAQNADGSFTLTPTQAADAGLAITPPSGYTGTMQLAINATADTYGATAVTTSQTLPLNVTAGAAQGATIALPSTVTDTENHTATFSVNVVDTHSGESVSAVTISGAPSGSVLTVGGSAVTADNGGVFHLTADQASNATVTLTPPTDYSGTVTLQVSATATGAGGQTETNTSPVTFTVGAVTQGGTLTAPQAVSTSENTSVALGLSVSDPHTGESVSGVTITGAPTGTTLTVGGSTIAADNSGIFHLTAAQTNDSSLTIVPPTDYSGTMNLTVTATAQNGTAAAVASSQTMAVTVNPVTEGATVTVPGSAITINENHSASFSLNVADTHANESVQSVTISGAPAGAILTVGGQSFSADATGSFYLSGAQASNATVTLTPPSGYSGSISLQVDAVAENGSATPVTTSGTVQINVNAQTQGATITASTPVSATENHSGSISLAVNDLTLGESVTAVTVTGAPSGSHLTVGGAVIAQNGDGSFTLTPAQAASAGLALTPPTDYSGTITLHVNATADLNADTGGTMAVVSTQAITVNVGAATQGATITAPEAVGVLKGHSATFALSVLDSHTQESVTGVTITGAPVNTVFAIGGHNYTVTSSTTGVTIPSSSFSNGQLNNASIIVTPPSTYTGIMTLQVNATAQETGAASSLTSQTISVDVKSLTTSMQLATPGNLTDQENHSVTFVESTYDRYSSAVKSVTVSGATSGTVFSVYDNSGNLVQTATASSSGSATLPVTAVAAGYHITATPPNNYVGTMSLTLTATDTGNRSSTENFNLVVTPVPHGATISGPTALTDPVNTSVSVPIHVTDSTTTDTISSVTVSGLPTGSTLLVNGSAVTVSNGTATLTSSQWASANLSLTPPLNYSGIVYLQVNATVTTGSGGSETNTDVIPINVARSTQGATIALSSTNLSGTENHSVPFSLNVTDSHAGESVSAVTISGAPSGAKLIVNGHVLHANASGLFTLTPAQAASASITFVPPADYSGNVTLHVNATASELGALSTTNSQTVTIAVTPVTSGAQIFAPTSTVFGQEDSSTSFVVNVSDHHSGESVTALTVTGLPTGTVLYIHGSATAITADGSGIYHLPTTSNFENIVVQPPTGYVGTMTLAINATAQNGTAAAVTTTQQVTVDILDSAPTVTHYQQVFKDQSGASITESIGAHSAAGNTLSYALVNGEGPAHGGVTFDQNGNFTYTANSGYTGTDQFQVLVSDNHGGAAVQSETVIVSDPFNSHQQEGFSHTGGSTGAAGGIFGGGGDAHISQGDGNYTIYGNDGTATTGAGVCKAQLSISALSTEEAYGAHMTYALGNIPGHCTVVDAQGNVLDSSHLTDSQINAGVYLQFPDNHVAASFALSCVATITEPNGTAATFAQTTVTVDTSFMGGNDNITVGNGTDVIYGGAGNNAITAGNGNDTVTAYDGNNNLTLGSGNDTVTLGDGNNNLTVNGAGSNIYSLGSGTNNLTFNNLQSAQTVNLTGSGGHDVLNYNSAMSNNVTDLTHSGGGTSEVVQNNGHSGSETFLMDFKGGDSVTGGTGSNWTDVLDLSGHAAAGTPLTITVGNQSWTEALAAHGSIDLTNNNTTHDVSGTVSFTDNSGHDLHITFTNIEKITY